MKSQLIWLPSGQSPFLQKASQRGNGHLVAVVGRAAGVQAGQQALRLLLNTDWCWQGEQQRGQLLGCMLVSLLKDSGAITLPLRTAQNVLYLPALSSFLPDQLSWLTHP